MSRLVKWTFPSDSPSEGWNNNCLLSCSQSDALNQRTGLVQTGAELWPCGTYRALKVQDRLFPAICCRDGWSSTVFRVSSAVMGSLGNLPFRKTAKKWTIGATELWSPSPSSLCKVSVRLSCQQWLIMLSSPKASVLKKKSFETFHCRQIRSLFTPNDKTASDCELMGWRISVFAPSKSFSATWNDYT